MNDIEWIKFIKEIIQKGENVNLKKECEGKRVGLNTLYRKVLKLKFIDFDLYNKFILLHPYKPRDIQGIDFEQLMRESIISGISQAGLASEYGISKRTIQRKFAQIKEKNFELFDIYHMYLNSVEEQIPLHYSVMEKVIAEYIPQKPVTEKDSLRERRKKFLDSLNSAKEIKGGQLYKHYQEQIARIDMQIGNSKQSTEERRMN